MHYINDVLPRQKQLRGWNMASQTWAPNTTQSMTSGVLPAAAGAIIYNMAEEQPELRDALGSSSSVGLRRCLNTRRVRLASYLSASSESYAVLERSSTEPTRCCSCSLAVVGRCKCFPESECFISCCTHYRGPIWTLGEMQHS